MLPNGYGSFVNHCWLHGGGTAETHKMSLDNQLSHYEKEKTSLSGAQRGNTMLRVRYQVRLEASNRITVEIYQIN